MPASALPPPQAQPLTLRSMHLRALGDRETLGRNAHLHTAKPAAPVPDPPPPPYPVRPLQSLPLPAGFPPQASSSPQGARASGLLTACSLGDRGSAGLTATAFGPGDRRGGLGGGRAVPRSSSPRSRGPGPRGRAGGALRPCCPAAGSAASAAPPTAAAAPRAPPSRRRAPAP